MKKIVLSLFILNVAASMQTWASVEQYVASVEKISSTYKQDTRTFFNRLDAHQTRFTPDQQFQFCGIVNRYIEQLYQAADQNRTSLDQKYRQMTKQDVIHQVMSSKEMLILKKYDIQCDVK
ncbi:MAG: hypothetical protein VB979_08000 [Acinetobacter sp.]|uniref:hypothetical protein n=1 Tax=Acinetobacter sp. TaxID=472 RepID=UPI003981F3AB